MKKIIAILLMTVFMLSIVGTALVQGKEATSPTGEDKIREINEDPVEIKEGVTRPIKLRPAVACESFTFSTCPAFCRQVCITECEGEICPTVCEDVRGSCAEPEVNKRPRPLKEKSETRPIHTPGRPDAFEVKIRQSYDLGDLKVTFLDVTEDSRCPANAMCTQGGRVEIKILVETDGVDEKEFLLSNNLKVGKYNLHLMSVMPFPILGEENPEDEYTAKIRVQKTNRISDSEREKKIENAKVRLAKQGLTEEEIVERLAKERKSFEARAGSSITRKVSAELIEIGLTDEEIKKLKGLRRSQAKEVFAQDPVTIKDTLGRFKEQKVRFNERIVPEEVKITARGHFEEAKIRAVKLQEDGVITKAAFAQSREELRDCDDNCEELEQKVLEEAREFVVKSGERVLAYLDKVVAKLQEIDSLSDERVSELIGKIETLQEVVEEGIQEAKDATTKQELKKASQKINSAWKRAKFVGKGATIRMLNSRVKSIIVRSDVLEKKLDRVLEAIEDKGIVIDYLDAKVDAFSGHIEEARKLIEASEAKLDEARDLQENQLDRDQIKALLDEARDLNKQAKDEIKQAHDIVVELVRAIKAVDGTISLRSAPQDEIILIEA